MSIIQGNAHTSAGGGYQIERSLRFNSADSAYLSRTPASAGNRRTFTFSFWIKRSTITTFQKIIQSQDNNTASINNFVIQFNSNDTLEVYGYSSAYQLQLVSTGVFRDVSAWYHVVVSIDTTQASSVNRANIYVNGQVIPYSTATYPTQNVDLYWNEASKPCDIGRYSAVGGTNAYYLNSYMTEINFIDGQALTPSSFGETDSATGVWKPKAYTGTYGTNGFFLKFADNSGTTSTTLGKDSSGNGNNWTPNNFSVTAGAGNDSLVDSPTAYGTDTGVGGEVRGNYCTLNPLDNGNSNILLTNGNLSVSSSTTWDRGVKATVGISSGKWYYEYTHGTVNAGTNPAADLGWTKYTSLVNSSSNGGGASSDTYLLQGSNGNKNNGGTSTSYGSSFTTGDTVMCALDLDNGKVYWGKNGTWFASGDPAAGTNAAYTGLSGTFFPLWYWGLGAGTSGVLISNINFGQRAFAYTAPSGFKALVTTNLPTPTIGATSTTQANDYFDVTLYTGTDATQTITNSGSMQPDLVWVKSRNSAYNHYLYDSIRGATNALRSSTTGAESQAGDSTLTTTTNGFTVTGTGLGVNSNGTTIVGWQWNAGGSTVTNTSGTISAQVRANTTSGFSIVTYTGTGANATVGHGLGVAPSMIILKGRTNADQWFIWHNTFTSSQYIYFNTTAIVSGANPWNSTLPTSTLFSLGTDAGVNGNTTTYVAYCFAPVAGYSAFGSYTGNGSTDGPMVYLGFRPRFVFWKNSSTTSDWQMKDAARSTYNVTNTNLYANLSNAENSAGDVDFLSNGFKVRSSGTDVNGSGNTIIYAAFAEVPTKFSLAR
jgi:hypothetical protein